MHTFRVSFITTLGPFVPLKSNSHRWNIWRMLFFFQLEKLHHILSIMNRHAAFKRNIHCPHSLVSLIADLFYYLSVDFVSESFVRAADTDSALLCFSNILVASFELENGNGITDTVLALLNITNECMCIVYGYVYIQHRQYQKKSTRWSNWTRACYHCFTRLLLLPRQMPSHLFFTWNIFVHIGINYNLFEIPYFDFLCFFFLLHNHITCSIRVMLRQLNQTVEFGEARDEQL